MRFCVRTTALSFGVLWAVMFFLVALAQQVWPTYGAEFLELMDGLYPGYAPGAFGSVIWGTLYALVDGAICGAVFAWLYNRFLGSKEV
jgi:phosphotransferase system  glucose/maltose/N-acetylglucosamine-specific IIC component